MPKTIRWGILGPGHIAAKFAHDLAALPDARLAACGSTSAERAAAFAAQWGIDPAHAHASHEALAADPEVDVVYVATPHTLHAAGAYLALRHGKAVLCEKPVATSAAETEALFDYARARNLFFMEAMWTRFGPHVERALSWVADGAIGPLRAVMASFGSRCRRDPESRLMNPALGGGGLLDLGPYVVGLPYFFLGAPESVRAEGFLTATGVDGFAALTLRWPGDRVALAQVGTEFAFPNAAWLLGEDGRIEFPDGWWAPVPVTLHRAGRAPETFAVPPASSSYFPPDDPRSATAARGYHHEIVEVHRCLREGRLESPTWGRRASVEVMRVLDAARAQLGLPPYPVTPTPAK